MLEIITSAKLAPRHGFFTRKGGASSGIFAGLNCGLGSSDQTEIVTINRARVAEAMGTDHLITVHQTHSAIALPVTGPLVAEADAMVTDRPNLALGILTADCQPVLFADPLAGVIGAAHAGWKGAKGGILEATLDAMENLGAKRANINAVIGPCISQVAYEIGPEFFETFTDDDPQTQRFFANGQGQKMLFDLPGYGLWRLREAGVGQAEWCGHCTYSAPEKFFSYRRTTHLGEADYGRLISVIML
jgi:polyphenol oxidase